MGYEPILPLVLEEKGMFLRQRDSAGVAVARLDVPDHRTRAEERRVERGAANPGEYAALMIAAAERALPHAIVLIVVDPPQHAVQHQHLQELRDRLAARGDPRLKLRQLPEVANPSELLDGYSYGGAARGRVMRAILPELLGMSEIAAIQGDGQLIRAARDRSNAAIAKHDLDGIAAAWMEDVHVVSSTSAQTAGKRADRTAWPRSSRIARHDLHPQARDDRGHTGRGMSRRNAASGRGSGPSRTARWRSAEPTRLSGARSMAAG